MATFRNVTAPVPTKTGVVDIDRFTREISQKITELNSALLKVDSGGGGGSAISVSNAGSLLTSGVTSFDFVGGGVTASAIGNAVTVTVIPTVVAITTKDEGVTLSSSVNTLDFTGYGIEASGAGATTTITVGGDPVVSVVITVNVALSGIPSTTDADGQTLSSGNLVLLTGQTTASQNGIYAIAAGAWSRVKLVTGNRAAGCRVYVLSGQFNYDSHWFCTSAPGSDVVGTNSLVWKCEDLLRHDIGFDSNDVFAVIYGDNVDTDASTFSSQITADTWTSFSYAVATPVSTATGFVRGPFGEQAIYMRRNMGILGPASTYPIPANYTLTFWAQFQQTGNNIAFSSSELLNVARTNTNTPTGAGWSSEYIFAASCPQNTAAGSGSDPLRYLKLLSRDSGGAASTFVPVLSNEQGGIFPICNWLHIAIVRRSDNYTYLYVNGVYITAFLTTNPPNNTSTGRWVIGRPGNADAGGVINGNYFRVSRVRLSNIERPVSFIREQSRRGLAWVA